MSIWGKVIGGVTGFAIGGPIGAIIGAVAGHHEKQIRWPRSGMQKSRLRSRQP